MQAKYYTYRNLHKGGFSTKHRGIVIARFQEAYLKDVEFRVSNAGNLRANTSGTRNVHAYAVSETPPIVTDIPGDSRMREIKYNPFKGRYFTISGRPIYNADVVYFRDGRCYTI